VARMVVIADDLTGAADCAASSAALGCRATVLLHSPEQPESEAGWPDTDILSIDANSRCLPAEQGAQLATRLVYLCASHNADSEYVLFKKIDSTLRGNVADELAALLHARRSISPANAKCSIVMAPALPAQGRTTVGGRLFVHGVPLEETDIWKTESRPAQSDILQLLATAGLSCGLVDRSTVRSGSARLRHAILQSAKHVEVVVCDAETDADLYAIAEASLGEPTVTALVGSAGLASQISRAICIPPEVACRKWSFGVGSTLFIVGTAASTSRQQAHVLESIPEVVTFHISPPVLLNSRIKQVEIIQSIQSGRDVLLMLEGEHCSNYGEQFLPKAFSDLLSRCSQSLGGLVATGGETARAALDALRIHRLRLLGEVEAGVPFSVADCWIRPLPIITKAGAFGSPESLVRCREFLRGLERVAAPVHNASVGES